MKVTGMERSLQKETASV